MAGALLVGCGAGSTTKATETTGVAGTDSPRREITLTSTQLRERVEQDAVMWKERGITLTVIGGPDEAGVVEIGVATRDEMRVVQEYYQGQRVHVSLMRPMPL